MTLVDKELKSSKEESILHFKREYERLLATVIGRFSDDRHQGLVYLRADKKNRFGNNSPIDWTYMFHYSACILRMTIRDRRISFLSISRQYMKYSSRLVFCLSSYILVRSSSSLEDRSITLIIQGYKALALLVYRQNICPISEQYWDFLRRLACLQQSASSDPTFLATLYLLLFSILLNISYNMQIQQLYLTLWYIDG